MSYLEVGFEDYVSSQNPFLLIRPRVAALLWLKTEVTHIIIHRDKGTMVDSTLETIRPLLSRLVGFRRACGGDASVPKSMRTAYMIQRIIIRSQSITISYQVNGISFKIAMMI